MKVVCIRDDWKIYHSISQQPRIHKGDIVTVVDEGEGRIGKADWYEFAEHLGFCYAKYMFRQIDEIEYKDVRKELAVLPQDEVPDVKEIKELVN